MTRTPVLVLLIALASCSRNPPAWTVVDVESALEIVGSESGVSMAQLRLASSDTFRFEASSCQEMLVLVERGLVRTSLTWLEAGRTARFSAPAVIQVMSEDGADLFVATVSTGEASGFEPSWDGLGNPNCTEEAEANEPRGASLGTLAGDANLAVPEHIHERSAEVLFVVSGSGTMRRGEETFEIGPRSFVYVPPGTRHGFVPDGTEPLVAYRVSTPPVPEPRTH